MIDRIQKIIREKEITSGAFADMIGVQRSSVSHILNGRNRPSLDFVLKTLKQFPEIDPEWLLLGVGQMNRNNIHKSKYNVSSVITEPSIFDAMAEAEKNDRINEEIDEPGVKEDKSIVNEVVKEASQAVYVKHIAIFYSDSSFSLYHPKEIKE